MTALTEKLSLSEAMRIARETRKDFEAGYIDKNLLGKLYSEYSYVGDMELFLRMAQSMFPSLNCGLASVYLRNRVGGEVVFGSYKSNPHSFLLLDDSLIIDITADQFGGPKVYVGPLNLPWSRTRAS